MSPRDLAATLLVMAIWGFNFVVAKVALQDFPPIFVTALRFFLVAAMLVPFVRVPRGRLGGILVFAVLLGGIHFPMMFTGLTRVDAGTAAVAVQLQVPFSALLASFLFGDRLGWRRAAGMAIAIAGVAVIAGEPRLGGGLGHLLLVIGASFVFAIANVHVKRMGPIGVHALNGWMALFATPMLLAMSLAVEEGQWRSLAEASWLGWAAVLYIVLMVTVVAYGLWYPLVERYDVNQTMPWTLTVPVFGVLSGVLALGEPVTPTLLAGGALTLAGVAVIVLRRPRAAAPDAGSPT